MMLELKGKKVLDLGCGFGEHCKQFIAYGAETVVGIDISKKMLEVAEVENCDSKIRYIHMTMEDIGQLQEQFDVVISSLAFHYVEDFEGVIKNIYNLLDRGFWSKNSLIINVLST